MDENAELQQFAEDLLQEVIASPDAEEDVGLFREEIFTRIFIDYLCEAGELEDGEVCYHSARGVKVNGYNIQEAEGRLDLFVSIFTQKVPPATVLKSEIDTAIKRLKGFLEQSWKGLYKSLEEASPTFDLAQSIYKLKNQLSNIRLFIFTDGLATTQQFKESTVVGDRTFSINVWDLRRLYRCVNSGKKRESIEIDFEAQFGKSIPCLRIPEANSDYDGCMLIIPGEILKSLYNEYGSRLLERNVRSFLQARGKVNKGIRQTIIKEPHRFLAYNNGISATAESVRFSDNGHGVAAIRDLQIVNGGQTTVSIYQAARKDKADLSRVYVQAKLTIVNSDRINEIVPLISRYANSQNKVSEADFSANEPFHIQIEELSRTIWAPGAYGNQKQTHWFYERARGQYLEAKNKEATPAKKRIFEETYPKSQVITKTDLAKFHHTYEGLPHYVSRGAQKNFSEFTARCADPAKNDMPVIDKNYFTHLVAKAILFKTAEKIVHKQNFGGYRANIVTYTLAYLSETNQKHKSIDLDLIWKHQTLSTPLQEVIKTVSIEVHNAIINPPEGKKNVTEWCKHPDCWKMIRELEIDM
jgi:hypothetical protein